MIIHVTSHRTVNLLKLLIFTIIVISVFRLLEITTASRFQHGLADTTSLPHNLQQHFSKLLGITSASRFQHDRPESTSLPHNLQQHSRKPLMSFEQTNENVTETPYLTGHRFDSTVAKRLFQISNMARLETVNCESIFQTGKLISSDISRGDSRGFIADKTYIKLSSDCHNFRFVRGYITSTLTNEEANFPLAYSIMVYTDAEMVEKLLRAIYRPHNYYCIHVDKKSTDVFYRAMSSIAKCFSNVFLTSRRIDVQWGEFSVLEPELQCMKELCKYPKWKYFLNLTGQEYPLKTNFELVKILTAYDGANDIECKIQSADNSRWNNSVPPHGIQGVKGSVHIAVNRDFVDYVLHNNISKSFMLWSKNTIVPDETYFASLQCNPQLGIRGSYKGKSVDTKPYLTRYKQWEDEGTCAGRFVRRVCILSTGDLPRLGKAKELFANKFYLDEDRIVVGCLEEKLFNNTRDEYMGIKTFNADYYTSLDFVKNKVI